MGDLILGAAGDDADMLGFGVGDLNPGNASWVLSRMAVELRRLPSRGETIDIYTWVSDYGRLFTTRNMVLTSDDGGSGHAEDGDRGIIGAAVTQWAMIDLDTRRPLDLSPLSNKATSLVDREPPIERPRKVGSFECTSEQPYVVVYSDIDFNGHVNSMKYLEWMVDTLPAGVLAALSSIRFDINYMHEATLGETLTICSGPDTANAAADATPTPTHHFEIRNATGTPICRATITPMI